MPSQDKLTKRIQDLTEAWAPPHARMLKAKGWRLSDGEGLVWVRNDRPSLRLTDEQARSRWDQEKRLRSSLLSAGDYRDSDRVDALEEELERLPSYEELAQKR